MRLEESCQCGAQLVVVFGSGSFSDRNRIETDEAWRLLASFRRVHVSCLPPVSDCDTTRDEAQG